MKKDIRDKLREMGAERIEDAKAESNNQMKAQRRLVRRLIVDPDSRLKAHQALIYLDTAPVLSDLSDDELFMEIDVKGLLAKHNEFRGTVEDKSVSRQFEKVVYLEDDLDPNDVRFHVITAARFNL
jgi:hypothetical protein